MNFTVMDLDKVIETTGVSYAEAKQALIDANGDADAAIAAIQSAEAKIIEETILDDNIEDFAEKEKNKLEELRDKLLAVVQEGNARKIIVKRKGEEFVSVPLNLGVIGGVVGLAAAPVAVIIGAVAAVGLDCSIEIVKKDGSTEEL